MHKMAIFFSSSTSTRACLLVLAIAAWSVNVFLTTSIRNPEEPCNHDIFLSPSSYINKSDIHGVGTFSPKFQAFVISSQQERVELFYKRNRESLPGNYGHKTTLSTNANATNALIDIAWFPAANGYDQLVLNQYTTLTGFNASNVSDYPDGSRDYDSPHHTGCFMSHWNLLRLALAGWESLNARPDALFVFEDDATCATNLLQELLRILPLLPTADEGSWDLLFVGGKPYADHHLDPFAKELTEKGIKNISQGTDDEFRQWACLGYFGRSQSGPFAPDGSRRLSLNQSYWMTRYITNTQSYIVNPIRVEKVLDILEHPKRRMPIDIVIAEAAEAGALKILMTTRDFCIQGGELDHVHIRDGPTPWEGFYSDRMHYRWGEMYFPECPGKL